MAPSGYTRRGALRLGTLGLVSAAGGCIGGTTLAEEGRRCLGTGEVPFTVETNRFVVTMDDDTVETLGFTLDNQTKCPISLVPTGWELVRNVDRGWEQVDRGAGESGPITVASGEDHRWSLSIVPHPTPFTESTTFIHADLSPGTYALEVSGSVDGTRIPRRARFTLTME